MSGDSGPEATVATGNAVLAGIAAADAITCIAAGRRHRGADHRDAAALLLEVTGDRRISGALRELVDFKDVAHYGVGNVRAQRARAALRRAEVLVEAARERVGL
jgi:hypothetical protein